MKIFCQEKRSPFWGVVKQVREVLLKYQLGDQDDSKV
jgi:hypothetical protein